MKQLPTKEQTEEALKILIQQSAPGFEAEAITAEERSKRHKENYAGYESNKKWWLIPAFIVDNRYYCGQDVYFGHDVVIDLHKKEAYTSKKGIFKDGFVFISDYFGFEEGAFYYRSI